MADSWLHQIYTKFKNNIFLKARNAADNGDVNILKVNASDKIEFGDIPQLPSTRTISNNRDIVDKEYVSTVSGVSVLGDLTDVDITTPTEGQGIVYDSVNIKWKNGSSGLSHDEVQQMIFLMG